MSQRLRLIFSHPPPIRSDCLKFIFQFDTRICSTVLDVQNSITQKFKLSKSEAMHLEFGGYRLLESDGAEIFEHDDVVSVCLKPGIKEQQLHSVTLSESEDIVSCLTSGQTDIDKTLTSDVVQEERIIGENIERDDKKARPVHLKRKYHQKNITTNPIEFLTGFDGRKQSKVDMTKYTLCDAPCSCTNTESSADLVDKTSRSDLVQEERIIGKNIERGDKKARPLKRKYHQKNITTSPEEFLTGFGGETDGKKARRVHLKRKYHQKNITTNPKKFLTGFDGAEKSKVDMTKYTLCDVCDDNVPCSCTNSESSADLVEEMLLWNEYQLYTPEDWKKMKLMMKSGIQKLTEKYCQSISPPPITEAQKNCLDQQIDNETRVSPHNMQNKKAYFHGETTVPETCLPHLPDQETRSVVDLTECGTRKDKCDISQERSHTVKSGGDHAKTLSKIFLKSRDSISSVSENQDSHSFLGEDDTKLDVPEPSEDFVKQMLECDGHRSHTVEQLEQMRIELRNGIKFLTKKHNESMMSHSPSTKSSSSSTIILPPVDMTDF